MSKPKTTAQNLESRFDAGEDVLDYFDTAKGYAGQGGEGQKNGGTSNIEHRTSNIEHRTSNIEHRTSNIEHRTSNIEHRTSKSEDEPSPLHFRLRTASPRQVAATRNEED
jgi:hypothetical protein